MQSVRKVIVPGYGGSGETHWQTHWQKGSADYSRIAPQSFDAPDLEGWLKALDDSVAAQPTPPVIVSHSLGCLLTAEYLHRTSRQISGAFMVAVPDPDGPNFPKEDAAEFADFYRGELIWPALVIASSNDPYASPGFASAVTQSWGAEIIQIGAHEHISEMGSWEEGNNLLSAFCAGASARYQATK
jgi:hypothetical protein